MSNRTGQAGNDIQARDAGSVQTSRADQEVGETQRTSVGAGIKPERNNPMNLRTGHITPETQRAGADSVHTSRADPVLVDAQMHHVGVGIKPERNTP